jgi:hypothetical protein
MIRHAGQAAGGPLSSNVRQHQHRRPHVLVVRSLAVWLLILLLAIVNGAFREAVLLPLLGDPSAHLVSGALLIGCIAVVSYLLVPRLGARSRRQLVNIGLFWLALTLAFEFTFGALVQGKSWSEVLAAYRFEGGNIWPLVLVVTAIAPLLFGRRQLSAA